MGTRIEAARKAADLTQAELGARLGVAQQVVGRWETGDSNPKLHHLVALARTLGHSTDALLGVKPMRESGTVEAAIRRDEHISDEAKKALLRAYRSALELPGSSS